MNQFIPFDSVPQRVVDLLGAPGALPENLPDIYLVRDLFGKIRLSVSDAVALGHEAQNALQRLAANLHRALGVRAYAPEQALLFVDQALLDPLKQEARELQPGVYWVDRLVTGSNWWTVRTPEEPRQTNRFTLYSVKGGVGRTTTAAVLAWHLAHNGERVLVVDLDLESPGLSSAMLGARDRPDFGVTDWFVEDLVGQGDGVLDKMTISPTWALDLEGDVHVAPAHGLEPGEYLAKLGRVYMDSPKPWSRRLDQLLQCLEDQCNPTVVLLESRSGLHDIAAATVTDLDAQVLLFATDSPSTWDDYHILFRHWQINNLATRIREKLAIVSALTPDTGDVHHYLSGFKERSWTLFQDCLYDEAPDDLSADRFSFDLNDDDAPHDPLHITWTLGLSAGASLRNLAQTSVAVAYSRFLDRFDHRFGINQDYPL